MSAGAVVIDDVLHASRMHLNMIGAILETLETINCRAIGEILACAFEMAVNRGETENNTVVFLSSAI